MKKALVFVLALILLVGVFAACGDKEEETTPKVTTTATPSGTTTGDGTSTTTGSGTTTTEPTTTPTQPNLEMSAADKEPVGGEENTEAGVQLPWMPF